MDGVNQYVSSPDPTSFALRHGQSFFPGMAWAVLGSFSLLYNIPDTHPLMDIWIVAQSLSGKVRFVF